MPPPYEPRALWCRGGLWHCAHRDRIPYLHWRTVAYPHSNLLAVRSIFLTYPDVLLCSDGLLTARCPLRPRGPAVFSDMI